MHMYITMLERVASRYAPSRALSFDLVHVFVALQSVVDWSSAKGQ
jgi:hypothetical protein